MRRPHALVAGVFTLLVALPAAAQEFKPLANLFGQKKPAPKPPKVDWNWRLSTEQAQPAKPSVVCGMTVIPADPKIDPKMRVAAPDGGVTFTMRAIRPAVCTTP